MSKAFFQEIDQSLVAYSNVGSDGSISVTNNNTAVLIATVPLTTGPFALSSSTMYAWMLYSFNGQLANGSSVDIERDAGSPNFTGSYGSSNKGWQGGSPPASAGLLLGGSTTAGMVEMFGLSFDGTNSEGGAFGQWALLTETINGSGDLEISLKVPVATGQAYVLRGFKVRPLYFGSV